MGLTSKLPFLEVPFFFPLTCIYSLLLEYIKYVSMYEEAWCLE